MECLNFADGKPFSLLSPLYQVQQPTESILDEVYIEDIHETSVIGRNSLFNLEYSLEDNESNR